MLASEGFTGDGLYSPPCPDTGRHIGNIRRVHGFHDIWFITVDAAPDRAHAYMGRTGRNARKS